MMSPESPIIVVVGPTAAGKSRLALAIAHRFDGEVVSADAFQVYRGLDIGTAKLDATAMSGIPHYCLDIADPDEHFSAARFAEVAAGSIDRILDRGRRPVLAGGSGFYLRALIDGLAPLPPQEPRWRAAIEALEERRGLGHLYAMLEALDPDWAQAVGQADRQRILRGLEVTLRLGEPMSDRLEREGRSGPRYAAIWVGLTRPRQALYARIERRVDAMLEAGWLAEVESLLNAGVPRSAPALRAIGYRELVDHLANGGSLGEARRLIVNATRRYAKRQLTWFRKQAPVEWFVVEAEGDAAEAAVQRRVLRYLEGCLCP